MLGRTYDDEVCSIARTLEVVGERWSLLIIRNALFAGSTRFGDFQRRLGVATNILQSRLNAFVEEGLMTKRPSALQPSLEEYVLTEKGRDLTMALVSLTAWGDRWRAPDGEPVLYRHAGCGAAVLPQLVCETCGPLGAEAGVEAHPGPGMPEDRAERMRARLAREHEAAAGRP